MKGLSGMRRTVVIGAGAAGVGAVVIGLAIVASQQGLFGGKARWLLGQADRAAARQQWAEAQEHLEELIATFPDSPWADDGLLKLGQVYEAQEMLLEARAMYRMVVERFPDSSLLGRAQQQLGAINVAVLFSPTVTEHDTTYQVRPGDTLGKIASGHATTVELIKRANGLSGDVIRVGRQLKIPRGQFSIVVDKSQRQLLLKQNEEFLKTYPIATGRENSTPEGTFKIVNRIPNPVWYTQNAVVPADSPENILGTRWMGFDKKGYGIHGSVDMAPITQQETAGCIRLINQDVEELFAIVPVGTEVTIVN